MAGAGIIQAELTIEMGQLVAALNAAQAAVARYAQGAGAAMAPANQAFESGTRSIQKWKGEQVQQARTADFIARSFREIGGASAEASEGISRFAGIGLEVLGKGGILGIGLAAASAIGWVVQQLGAATKEAEKFAAETKKALDEIGDRWAGRTLGIAQKSGTGTDTENTRDQELLPLLRERAQLMESLVALDARAARGEFASFGTFGAETYDGALKKLAASLAAVDSKIELIKEKAGGANILEESANAAKLAYENLANEMGRLAAEEDRSVTVQAERLKVMTEEKKAGIKAAAEYEERLAHEGWVRRIAELKAYRSEMLDKAQAKGAWDASVTATEGEGYDLSKTPDQLNKAGTENATKSLMKYAAGIRTVQEMWAGVANNVSGAFDAIGGAVGGAFGGILKMLGQALAGAVSLAVAMSAALPPPFGAINMIATAATVLATIASTVASIPSFEVGTSYVPRTGLALIHQGERIIPAGENARGFGGATYNIYALDSRSFEDSLDRNDSVLRRKLTRMARSG
jgi:hypothetical protein